MFIVNVLFETSDTDAVLAAVKDLLERLVSRQPGFRRARLHAGVAPSENVVVNYMEWDSREAFQAFRAAHGAEVTEAVGRFEPRFLFFQIAHAEGGWSSAA
ncbi:MULTISPECIES: antibiotic biosynthesis monooxygenase [unclassified Roseitalea]|uniref:antibiotic biosynthesis monooxygenase family protein n=1 Tax=unclassified Roseitalea TaxID=2639107 RepID=UPI00273E9E91|nr:MULTISPECIES: antibiotic biosynthesis monooxygenase [unclassified Roseitalea]